MDSAWRSRLRPASIGTPGQSSSINSSRGCTRSGASDRRASSAATARVGQRASVWPPPLASTAPSSLTVQRTPTLAGALGDGRAGSSGSEFAGGLVMA